MLWLKSKAEGQRRPRSDRGQRENPRPPRRHRIGHQTERIGWPRARGASGSADSGPRPRRRCLAFERAPARPPQRPGIFLGHRGEHLSVAVAWVPALRRAGALCGPPGGQGSSPQVKSLGGWRPSRSGGTLKKWMNHRETNAGMVTSTARLVALDG